MTGKRRRSPSDSENSSDDCIMELDSSNGRSRNGKGSNTSSNNSADGSAPRKRGRGPSKRPCLNRNALMARVNRQRKKEYLEKIENKLSYYRRENKNLSTVIQQQGIDLKRLTAEVSYLRNVLNNNSSITALLKTMNDSLKTRGKMKNEEDKWDSEKMADNKKLKINEKKDINLPESNINSTDMQLGIVDIDQLDAFDSDLFELPTNSDGSDGIDVFRSNENQADNLFDNLDNSGICLHVNSGRVSLEFCSICHLNSINSDDT